MATEAVIQAILDFWFGEPPGSYADRKPIWFGKQPDLDAEIRQRFGESYQQDVAGQFTDWRETPQGCLALILLFDQFARNMFRDTAQMFATDPQALELARFAVAQAYDQQLSPLERIFIYLPFEHSENRQDQVQSVELFQRLVETDPELADVLDYAKRHQVVVDRFGRFPHRNKILGRDTTAEEAEFLTQPGSSF
ncbi:MAG: DUF924 family protein [Elainella sp.]